jgi:putative membrane protein
MNRFSLALAVGLGAAAVGSAQPAMKALATPTDAGFVAEAGAAGMTEVEASRLALQKSSDEKVKAFALHMVNDHTAAGDALKTAASEEGLSTASSLDATQRQAVDKLKSLSGAQFDAAYKSQMLSDHRQAVALFEKESREARSPVAQFAAATLPTLKDHLRMAEELSASPSDRGGK